MHVDPSYAEYVDARWPMLYRLAVLLVGDENAPGLTEEALVRAYLHWRDAQEAASTDAHVQGLLARTAVEDFARDATGPGFDGLGTRDRAIVVLSCFELLDDSEVARALPSRDGDVAAEKAAVLARLGLAGPEVAVELERRAESVAVPAPPVDDLVGRATARRRRQRRRAWRWPGVAALVAVAAVAAANLGTSGPARPAKPAPIPGVLARLPDGGPPGIAFTDGLALLLPGGPVILAHPPKALLQAGDWVYVVSRSGAIDQFDARTLGSTTLIRSSAGQVVADPSGRHVAWLQPQQPGRRPWVTVRTAVSDPELLQEHEQAFPAGADPFVLDGMDRSGDLVASRPAENRAWVWHTGLNPAPGRPVLQEIQALGVSGIVRQVTAEDLVVEDGPFQYAVGEVEDATFLVADEVPAVMADFADPEARRIVYVDLAGEAHVIRRTRPGGGRPGHDVRLRLPALRGGITALRWEDDDHVLLDATDASLPGGALVRCDVRTGACEIAAKFEGSHLLAR